MRHIPYIGRILPPPPPRNLEEAEVQIKEFELNIRVTRFMTGIIQIVGAIGLLFILASIVINHFGGGN